jgi:hypothetical protein
VAFNGVNVGGKKGQGMESHGVTAEKEPIYSESKGEERDL